MTHNKYGVAVSRFGHVGLVLVINHMYTYDDMMHLQKRSAHGYAAAYTIKQSSQWVDRAKCGSDEGSVPALLGKLERGKAV